MPAIPKSPLAFANEQRNNVDVSMMNRHNIVLALSGVAAFGRPAEAAVVIEGTAGCLESAVVEAAANDILTSVADRRRVNLLVSINAAPLADGGTRVTLRGVTPDGEVVLDRQFELKAGDCQHAPSFIGEVLERFVRRLPLSRWTSPPPGPPLPPPEDLRWTVGLGVAGRLEPVTAELDLFLSAVLGEEPGSLTTGVVIRGAYPQSLGMGTQWELAILATVGWRHARDWWQATAEARAGAVLVSGSGYDANHTAWLAWGELAAGVALRWGVAAAGPYVALSPMRHQTRVQGTASELAVAPFRAGLQISTVF